MLAAGESLDCSPRPSLPQDWISSFKDCQGGMRHNQLASSPLLAPSCGGHVQSVEDQRGSVACLSTLRVFALGSE